MYLHLGQETVVESGEIIGIFDLENATLSKHTRNFLAGATKRGEVVNVSMELPKSFIICLDKKMRRRVYISQLSCATLLKRTTFSGGMPEDAKGVEKNEGI